jgi:protein-disulfide isomerase
MHAKQRWHRRQPVCKNRFWEMHDLLYREQSAWSKAPGVRVLFNSYAGMLGLNIDRFEKDMESDQAKARIKSDEQQALALGLAMTPSIFVNNGKLPRAYVNPPGLRIAIDSAIKKASK